MLTHLRPGKADARSLWLAATIETNMFATRTTPSEGNQKKQMDACHPCTVPESLKACLLQLGSLATMAYVSISTGRPINLETNLNEGTLKIIVCHQKSRYGFWRYGTQAILHLHNGYIPSSFQSCIGGM